MLKFKVGDDFIILDPSKDGLNGTTEENRIYIVGSLQYVEDAAGINRKENDVLWFSVDRSLDILNFVSIDNIRRPTKLEKVLK